jgi:hypothetical protein
MRLVWLLLGMSVLPDLRFGCVRTCVCAGVHGCVCVCVCVRACTHTCICSMHDDLHITGGPS